MPITEAHLGGFKKTTMKPTCKNCAYLKDEVCTKNKKNGYNNCKTYKPIPLSELQKEFNTLRLNGSDKVREEYLKGYLEMINGGM